MTNPATDAGLHLLQTHLPGLKLFRLDTSTTLELVDGSGTTPSVELRLDDPHGRPGFRLEVDLGAAAGYWQPGGRQTRVIPPDWLLASTSLVRSAPAGALYDAAGDVLLGWAASEAVAELSVRCGVSEEHKTFVVEVRPTLRLTRPLTVRLDSSGDQLADVVGRLAAWMSDHQPGRPRVASPVTRVPVYSTWYAFSQDLDHDRVLAEAALAAESGCGAVFLDDGWQRHAHGRGYQACGDWTPDEAKFPDLRGTVDACHDRGLAVALWIAPLLLGPGSDAFESLRTFAPAWAPDQGCHVLDPRYAEVRHYVADTCLRLVETYAVDLLKIDFLDVAMTYHGTAGPGDVDDLGQAMAEMLSEVRRRLDAAGRDDVAFEFRQPYVNPAIARFGEILRANDCPGDSALNRSSIVDARLLSVGQVIHSDPILWGPDAPVEAVAQQLFAAWFSVPQISMRLAELTTEHRTALAGLLRLWELHRDVSLDGQLTVSGAELGYTHVQAERADLQRLVAARYAPVVVDVPDRPGYELLLINATAARGMVVRLPRPIAGGVLNTADGSVLRELGETGSGLIEFDVPAFGTARVRLG